MHPGSDWVAAAWRSRFSRIAAAGLSLLLILQIAALAAPGGKGTPATGVTGGEKTVLSRWPAPGAQNPAAKVDPAVSKAFAAGGKVTYLIKLRARADVAAAAASARAAVSPAARDLSARTAVIDALKQTAEESQRGLLAQLAREQTAGAVQRYESFWIANIVLVTSTRDVMERIAKRADVEQILPDTEIYLVQPQVGAAGDADLLSAEWGVQRVGAPSVWAEYGITGTGAVVASLDTGVDWTHPALREQWRGLDRSTGGTDPTYSWYDAVNGQSMPYDDHGHGTHTTGTAVGVEPDGSNQIGVAPGARWIGVKILSGSGSGSTENILRAGQWILAPGGDPSRAPDVVNNSWGGGPGINEWFRDTVAAWRAAGIFPVFASGNGGPGEGSVSSPGNYPESFAVGATDISDNLAGFSGRGPSPYGEIKPQVAAPGVNVRSSVPGGGYQGGWNGTSMAAPHVAGAVALLRSANAALTVDQIEQTLISSADAKSSTAYPGVPNNGYGHGILNAYNAVAMLLDGVATVSGRVLTGGDDLEPPVVAHTPVTEGYRHMPIELVATAGDDVAVTMVQLRFRMPGMTWWGVVDMARTAGDHRMGTYRGLIPAEMAAGDQVEYYIHVQDYGGNSAFSGSPTRPHVVPLLSGISAGYLMDFEGAATGWIHGGSNDPWAIGEPTSGPSGAHSGARVAATNLSGDYPDNAAAYLLSPPIDLSSGPVALRFWQWFDLENNWDHGYVLVSGDGGASWDIHGVFTGLSGGWRQERVDLSPYAGSPVVFVAFYLLTDGSVTRPGWYLDDIELYVASEAPPAPANLTGDPTATGSVLLTWEASTAPEVSHYTVYRSASSGTGYVAVASTAALSYLDSSTTPGETYHYVVTATDIFGNESEYSNEASVTVPDVTVLFADDMESGPGDWTHGGANDTWAWGAPTSGPRGAHSGAHLWATGLAGDYLNSSNAYLRTPSIPLTGVANISLQFAHWHQLETNWDYGRLEISTDGGTSWTRLASYTGSSSGWQQPLVDLSAYAGQTVLLQFRLETDSSVVQAGWYVDDVIVAGTMTGGTAFSHSLAVETKAAALSTKGKPPAPATPQMALPSGSAKQQQATAVVSSEVGIMALPVDGTVTVLETERVVRTNPADGSYSMTLPAREFTLRAEAYGFYPQDRPVSLSPDSHLQVNFMLTPVPRGRISGRVTDARTGEPLAGVAVAVSSDPRIPAVTTGADGTYLLEVLEGDQTVAARLSGYYPAAAPIYVPGGGSVTLDLAMEPFIGMPGEIRYDDGSAENAWGFYADGNGWGVRMSPRTGESAAVLGGRFYLWNETWPSPGGDSFRAAIHAANPDGSPGALLAGPIRVTGAVRGAWNDVDFSHLGLTVTGDFYLVYLQDQPFPNTPGLGFDDNPPDSRRNWQTVGGAWSPWEMGGNAMIRAVVQYEVGPPVITAPADGTYTNRPAVRVTGQANAGTLVGLYRNGETEAMVEPDSSGGWAADLVLREGENRLTATATVPGDGPGSGTTRPSEPVRVILDTAAPALTVSGPAEGHLQRTRIITVTGQVADVNLERVTVNGSVAVVGADGLFMVEVIGQEGENLVSVLATDLAGNRTLVERRIQIDTVMPQIRALEPASDVSLAAGDTLHVAFDSEPGLALAAFEIALDLTGGAGASGAVEVFSLAPGEMAMAEVSPGRYEASWDVPDGFAAGVAYVRVRAVDAAGNEARQTAEGRVTITGGRAPVAVISGPSTGRVGEWLVYDARQSYDPDGRIVAYEFNMGNGTIIRASRVRHRYTVAGTYTITLTVTDDDGLTGVTTMQVTIRSR